MKMRACVFKRSHVHALGRGEPRLAFEVADLGRAPRKDLRSYGLEDARLERATDKVPLWVVVGAICTHARLVRTLAEDHGREGVLAQELLLAPVVTTGVQPVLAAEFVESRGLYLREVAHRRVLLAGSRASLS